jgi:uncharacterized protein YdeI (YjbR/CyaY-like superfamily)
MENQRAASTFEEMTYSQRKEYVDWISTARQTATRASRVGRAMEMLAAGKKRVR